MVRRKLPKLAEDQLRVNATVRIMGGVYTGHEVRLLRLTKTGVWVKIEGVDCFIRKKNVAPIEMMRGVQPGMQRILSRCSCVEQNRQPGVRAIEKARKLKKEVKDLKEKIATLESRVKVLEDALYQEMDSIKDEVEG